MSEHFTVDETVAAIAGLTHTRLTAYIEARIIVPVNGENGPLFAPVDRARLQLICELAESHELADEALAVVMSLVDQLHGARADLRALGQALDTEAEEVRQRVLTAWRAARGG